MAANERRCKVFGELKQGLREETTEKARHGHVGEAAALGQGKTDNAALGGPTAHIEDGPEKQGENVP